MSIFKRIIVALDGSSKDEPLLKHAHEYIQKNLSEKIYFIHVQESLELPDDVVSKYPDMLSPLDESIKTTMNNLIHEHIPNIENFDYDLIIEEGNPAETIIKVTKRKQADLIIIGTKSIAARTGAVARKVASFSPCSVLFAPDLIKTTQPKILLPLDFSESSKDCLNQIEEMASLIDTTFVKAINCYKVPTGYSTTGKSYEEVAKVLEEVSQKKLDHFVAKTKKPELVETKAILMKDGQSVAETIYETAKKEEANIIVIGSKTRTWMASMLLSSTAEDLLASDIGLPILIYKSKGKTEDIFALFDRI
ncbi:universal stress protein [Flammeovirga sp. SubArs3]|uniref:universal stress protein n=1 Tax=Flammeovirga sp. SubArs3 TaxID=2995316 RepID=UPI00248C7493|nr:universal stress protein [Flammeovirga sp. SubArs3]